MASIRMDGTRIDGVRLKESAGTLALSFQTDMLISELSALFEPQNGPEIEVLEKDGSVTGLYKNHALTSLMMETIGGVRQVSISLAAARAQLNNGEDAAALQAKMEELEDELKQTREALEAITEGIEHA